MLGDEFGGAGFAQSRRRKHQFPTCPVQGIQMPAAGAERAAFGACEAGAALQMRAQQIQAGTAPGAQADARRFRGQISIGDAAGQIDFAEHQSDRHSRRQRRELGGQPGRCGVLRAGGIQYIEHPVGVLHGAAGAADTLRFGRVGGLAQARSVDEIDGQSIDMDGLAQQVAGRSRCVRDDGDFLTRQSVEEGGFAGVRLAGDHHGQPFAQQRTLARGCGEGIHCAADRGEALPERAIVEGLGLLVRKIDGRFDLGAKPRQRGLQRPDVGREFPLQRAHRGARRRRRAGVDQVGDRLGLRHVDLAVQEGTFSEFPWLGLPAAQLQQAPHQKVGDHCAAMPVQLEHVLAGERGRCGKVQRQSLIQRVARGVEKTRHLGAARRRQVSQNRDRKARHQRAGDPHDANRPAARGGCDGHDGIRRGHRLRQPRFLATSASTTWLTRHCCAIDSTVLVSQ